MKGKTLFVLSLVNKNISAFDNKMNKYVAQTFLKSRTIISLSLSTIILPHFPK